MNTKVATWTGEESDSPKKIPKFQGKLYAMNDSWMIAATETSIIQLTFPHKINHLKIPGNIIQSSCNNSSALLVTNNGEVWGFSTDKNCGVILRKDTKSKIVKIDELNNIIQVSLGKTHAAAIDKEGKLYTWGIGEDHQLGDMLTTKHGPILVKNAEIFNTQQVLSGEKYTCIRTLGGFVYIFGMLNYSESCTNPIISKQCPYTLTELEDHFTTSLCNGCKFVAALTSTGSVFLFDACMKLVKLSLYQKEILSIASTENCLLGMDKGCLYQWKEAPGLNKCGLKNWNVKVFLLQQAYLDLVLVSGYGKNIGIVCANPNGSLGKVIKIVNESEDIEIPDDINEERKNTVLSIDNNLELGLRIIANTINQFIRLNFHKLANKIDYKIWNPEKKDSENSDKAIYMLVDILVRLRIQIQSIYFNKLIRIYSKQSTRSSNIIFKVLLIYHQRYFYAELKRKCRILTAFQKNNIKFGLRMLGVLTNKILKNKKSSAFIQFLLLKPKISKINALSGTLNAIYKHKICKHFQHIFNYIDDKRQKSIQIVLIRLALRKERDHYIKLMSFFGKMKYCLSNNGSNDSKKSSEYSNSSQQKINYKLSIPLQLEKLERNSELASSPRVEKTSQGDVSPRIVKKPSVKEIRMPRNKSKGNNIEKSKNSEIKFKQPKKGIAEEIKSRQIKNKLLKFSSMNSKETEWEKSPTKFPSSPIKIQYKLYKVADILEVRIKTLYKSFLDALKGKKINLLFTFAPEKSELLFPVAAPEIWKLKVYNLGINKLNTMIKKRIRNGIFAYLFS